ncbi:MAG: hypothetical protein N0E48_18790 [Candidatus Thiodiazotropha endolucinida]|nr:hypothetical protein [Candidatus Thiodiazotropha taylori]MCW4345384.1 hypothetical protein [Candidatus Thiodiazotropha endolucinida]
MAKKATLKEIYCAVCDKWLTGYNSYRHVNSQIHQYKLTLYKLEDTCSSVRPTSSTETILQTPPKQCNQKAYEHYRIEGSTLKKCPHQHNSILDKCKYFDGQSTESPEEDHDCHWHVKQKLFEQEQEQVKRYPDIHQPTDSQESFSHILQSDDEEIGQQTDFNNADASREEQENRSNFYFEEISETELKHILDDSCESDDSDGDCLVDHNNQEHEYTCKKCNPTGYKEYRQMLNM